MPLVERIGPVGRGGAAKAGQPASQILDLGKLRRAGGASFVDTEEQSRPGGSREFQAPNGQAHGSVRTGPALDTVDRCQAVHARGEFRVGCRPAEWVELGGEIGVIAGLYGFFQNPGSVDEHPVFRGIPVQIADAVAGGVFRTDRDEYSERSY